MKVIILQTHGHHKANEKFREALNLCRAFTRLGVNAIVTGPGYKNYGDIKALLLGAQVVICLENYERDHWVPDLSKLKAYTVFWTIDSHVRIGPHLAFANKHHFNLVLSSTSEIVPRYTQAGFDCQWFPNCYPADLIDDWSVKKKYRVGFCGMFPGNRRAWYNAIAKRVFIHLDTFVIGNDMVAAVNGYKIHLNRNIKNDVNYRTFETLGCGTFLLTNNTDRLRDLFTIGKHLEVYKDQGECVEMLKYYLKNESKREEIAKAGYQHVRENHTYDNRAHLLHRLLEERV